MARVSVGTVREGKEQVGLRLDRDNVFLDQHENKNKNAGVEELICTFLFYSFVFFPFLLLLLFLFF